MIGGVVFVLFLCVVLFAGAASALGDDELDDYYGTVNIWSNTGGHFELQTGCLLDEVKGIYGASRAKAVSSVADLGKIGDGVSDTLYILTKDIYFTEPACSSILGGTGFVGTFVGNGFTIYNLTISTSSEKIGFVGTLGEHGALNGVVLSNVKISGGSRVGGLVGYADSASDIIGCSVVHSDIDGVGNNVGGLVGHASSAVLKMDNCTVANCSISGKQGVGGLVGYANPACAAGDKVENCCVSGIDYVGGLVGYANSANVHFSYCNAVNCIIAAGGSNIGGLVGKAENGKFTSCVAKDCTVAGTKSSGENIGGLVGFISSATLNDCKVMNCAVAGNKEHVNKDIGFGSASAGSSYETINVDVDNSSYKFITIWNGNSVFAREIENDPKSFFKSKDMEYYSYDSRASLDSKYTILSKYANPLGFGYFPASEPCTITFYTDTTTHTTITVPAGALLQKPADPAKTGYTFSGWRKNSPTGEIYQFGTPIAENITLYAAYSPNTYYITYNSGGGIGEMANQQITYDTNATLTPNTYIKKGYHLTGWNKTSESGTKIDFENKAAVKNLTVENNGTYPLYAVWNTNITILILNPNGGIGGTPAVNASYSSSSLNTPITNPTRIGHTFNSWNTMQSGGIEIINAAGTLVPGDGTYTNAAACWVNTNFKHKETTTLYANWTPNKTTITFDGSGAADETVPEEVVIIYGSIPAATSKTPEKTGCTFKGWYDKTDGTGSMIISSSGQYQNIDGYLSDGKWVYENNALTLYAAWTTQTYSVPLNQQGGYGGKHTVTAVYNTAMPVLTNYDLPIKHDYTFDGYYDAIDAGTKYYNTDGSSAHIWDKTDAATLYAHWIPLRTNAIERGSRSDKSSFISQQKEDIIPPAEQNLSRQSPLNLPPKKTQHPTSKAPYISILAGIGAALIITLKKL